MHISRKLTTTIQERLRTAEKIQIIYGPRQVGKTTMLRAILENYKGKHLSINGDEQQYMDVLSSRDSLRMQRLVAGYDLLFIDEAQQIPDIGINLKILHDHFKELKILVTGSSSLDLVDKTAEALTGRYWSYTLLPISLIELSKLYNPFELDSRIHSYLQHGLYPEVLMIENEADKAEHLSLLTRAYLYKDVLELSGIRYAYKIRDLLRLLAYQIGDLVSYNELGNSLGLSTETVQHYMELLEKAFVIYQLQGFSRNLRKEITKNKKVYFYDLGIRNALIENFNPVHKRNDVGKLWENFLFMERLKRNLYRRDYKNSFFWRTYTGAELDLVEESGGVLAGFEFKSGDKIARAPKTWLDTYQESTFEFINRRNYLAFSGVEG